MLLLTSVLGLASLIYALGRWDAAGPRFHALFMLQLVGLNGAFLTGDLFNLFVFFEVLLAASYGLMLHGSGAARVRAALHYVAINVAASLLFLIGASLIYGTVGTLNLAELALRYPTIAGSDLALFEAGLAILGTAFLLKAGMWPLSFWLAPSYGAASPPAAALFAILSKVGIYAVLRVSITLFGTQDGDIPNYGGVWLLYGGVATVCFGTIGVLASRSLARLAGFSVLISSGTLLAALGAGAGEMIGPVLFYLVNSTLALGAFYLLIELIEPQAIRAATEATVEQVFEDEYVGAFDAVEPKDDEEDEVGVVIPATIAILGGGFVLCCLLLAGLPPLSGFISKFALIDKLMALDDDILPSTWLLISLIIVSGIATVIATTRAGVVLLWTPSEMPRPVLRVAEVAPIGLLLATCLGMTIFAGPAMNYMEETARSLATSDAYIQTVVGAPRVPAASTAP